MRYFAVPYFVDDMNKSIFRGNICLHDFCWITNINLKKRNLLECQCIKHKSTKLKRLYLRPLVDTELPFPSNHSSTWRSREDFVVRYQVSLTLASGVALLSWVERLQGEWSGNNEKFAAHLPSRYENWSEHCWRKFQLRKAPGKRTQNCWTSHVAYVLLGVVVQSLKPVKLLNQQLPTFLLFRDHRSVA